MSWKTAIEARMKKYGQTKATLAAGSKRSKAFITLLLHDDENRRKTGMSLATVEAIANALHTSGWQLWKEAKK